MTYREKLQELHPEAVSPKYMGGVENCPQDWFYLSPMTHIHISNECGACELSCRECWNNEYKGEKPR